MTGVILCRDEQEYKSVIELAKDHMVFEGAVTDQNDCEIWTKTFYPGVGYEDGDAYGVVYIG